MNSDNNCRENLSYNSKFTSHFTFVYTCRNQGRINLARGPWHIFRAGPLALVVGVGSGGRGGGGVEVALVEGKIGSFVAQTQSVIENI